MTHTFFQRVLNDIFNVFLPGSVSKKLLIEKIFQSFKYSKKSLENKMHRVKMLFILTI